MADPLPLQELHNLVKVIVLILQEPAVVELQQGGLFVSALNVLPVRIGSRSS